LNIRKFVFIYGFIFVCNNHLLKDITHFYLYVCLGANARMYTYIEEYLTYGLKK